MEIWFRCFSFLIDVIDVIIIVPAVDFWWLSRVLQVFAPENVAQRPKRKEMLSSSQAA